MTQCNLKDMESMTEEEYLAQYKPSDYERPSVTVDMLIFTITRNQRLAMILIKRGGHPERGKRVDSWRWMSHWRMLQPGN